MRRAVRAPLNSAHRVGRPCDYTLDPQDAGIDKAIMRLERKSFVKDGVIPEIQYLLLLPPDEAKAAFLPTQKLTVERQHVLRGSGWSA